MLVKSNQYFSYHYYFYLFFSALTEKIVAVLPRMKCPHRLEPHQIQGLDFINIFPVIQVTKLILPFEWAILSCFLHGTINLEILSIT